MMTMTSEQIAYAKKIKVLMYHRILPRGTSSQARGIAVDEGLFRQQLTLLSRWGYTAITFRDCQMIFDGELSFPKKPVIITFDDGYLDTYDNAFPLLQEYGMRAVVFVLGDRNVRTLHGRNNGFSEFPLMNERQILELHGEGFEIASHGLRHRGLTSISSSEAWEEISRSRMLLEILLNSPVTTFAYPYGLLNDTLKKMVKDAGYRFACSVATGPVVFGKDRYDIRRISIKEGNGLPGFVYQIAGPYLTQRFLWWKCRQALGSLPHAYGDVAQVPGSVEETTHAERSQA